MWLQALVLLGTGAFYWPASSYGNGRGLFLSVGRTVSPPNIIQKEGMMEQTMIRVALQNSVKSFKRAAPREQLANGPDMIGQICGHGRGGLER
jgi:hypothetical protein